MYDLIVYSDDELRRIQQLELNCLEAIAHVCEKLDVEYFLIGGSALGAVRHGGFIPWDDDIDIGMTRKNYNKFINNASRLLPSNYHLQTPSISKNCPYFYSKIRIDGTEFVEYCNHRVNMHQGVYVDIFPFDEVPDDENENIRQFNTVKKLVRRFTLRQSPDVSSKPITMKEKLQSYVRYILHLLCKLQSYDKLIERLELEFTKYNGTGQSSIACLNFPVRKTEYIRLEDLYPLIDYKFENIIVKVPNNYDKYLKTHYGDYMKLPSEVNRFGHKPYKVFLGEEGK